MKKCFTIFYLFISLLFSSCSVEKSAQNISNSNLAGSLNIVGSTSMQELIDALIPEFNVLHPKIRITKSGSGSSEAVKAVLNNSAQIGDLSRNLNQDEQANQFVQHKIALDGIVVAVNNSNPVKNLSIAQLSKIYSGEIKNWKDVGGNNELIVVVGREAASGTRTSFEKFINKPNACKHAVELDNNGKIKEKIIQNKNLGNAKVIKVAILYEKIL